MHLKWRWWFIGYGFTWSLLGLLMTLYFQGTHWPSLYGGFVHQLSRLHVLSVHTTVGSILLLAFLESVFFFKKNFAGGLVWVRNRFHHVAHVCMLGSLLSGLTMQLIENYPNPLIAAHLQRALVCYVGLVGFSLLCQWPSLGRWRWIGAAGFVALVVNTAHLGGVVAKGAMFFN